jgi:rhodanese-related sulfurtransferase
MKKKILAICFIMLIQVFSGVFVNAISNENKYEISKPIKLIECPININVYEAWDLLNNTGNGIQIPIDVRFKYEWNEGFIDTPWPEYPRWYSLSLLKTEDGLQAFMDMYAGVEVILYCKAGSRSLQGAQILCDAGFIGTVYNMQGGITAWITEGYPIRNNTEPTQPDIIGPLLGEPGEQLFFNFSTNDIDEDRVYYWIDWNDTTIPEWIGPFLIDEKITLAHFWDEVGTYLIKAKTKDIFNEESDFSIFEVTILENQPPYAPTISGSINGKPKIEYEYTFNAVDSNYDDVKYLIYWGDNTSNWTDFNSSGTDVKVKHMWSEEGAYNITAKAQDIHGAEGPEGTLTVTIPRNKQSIDNIFLRFLEKHPQLFPILKQLLGLQLDF